MRERHLYLVYNFFLFCLITFKDASDCILKQYHKAFTDIILCCHIYGFTIIVKNSGVKLVFGPKQIYQA